MNFTTSDTQSIKESYQSFLINLKNFICGINNQDVEKQFKILSYLFQNGYLTTTQTIKFDSNYPYLGIPIELSEGIQVTIGTCCCRHANELLNDILRLLNYDSKILFIYIDENNDWHIKPNGCNCNHMAVTLNNSNKKIILDLYNNFIFTSDYLGNVITINKELTQHEKEECHQFKDDNIKKISKTLKKYYKLKSHGITHIYDDDYY